MENMEGDYGEVMTVTFKKNCWEMERHHYYYILYDDSEETNG
jgi:hypothetical protein